MTMEREPPCQEPPRGSLASMPLWGLAFGVVYLGMLWCWQQVPYTALGWLLDLIKMATPIVLFGVAGWLLVCPAWRRRSVVLGAVGFALGFFAADYAEGVLREPSFESVSRAVMPDVFWLAFVAGAAAGVWLAVRSFRRERYVKAVRTFSWRCYGCGNDLTALSDAAACPGCGRDRRHYPEPPGWVRPPAIVRRAGLTAAAALVVGGAVVHAMRWHREIPPLQARLASLGSTEFYDLPVASPVDDLARLTGSGVVLRRSADSTMALYVVVPRGRAALPAVRIWLVSVDRLMGSGPVVPLGMSPPVVCDLTGAEAEWVFRKGMPASLAQAMYAAGAASTVTDYWVSAEDLRAIPPGAVVVTAAPHLK